MCSTRNSISFLQNYIFLLTVFCKFLAQALGIPTICFTAFPHIKALCFCISLVLEFLWLMEFFTLFLWLSLLFSVPYCHSLNLKIILSPSVLGLFTKNTHDLTQWAEFRDV
jgi:hypothetical protein